MIALFPTTVSVYVKTAADKIELNEPIELSTSPGGPGWQFRWHWLVANHNTAPGLQRPYYC